LSATAIGSTSVLSCVLDALRSYALASLMDGWWDAS
jgi:hypothetical protein